MPRERRCCRPGGEPCTPGTPPHPTCTTVFVHDTQQLNHPQHLCTLSLHGSSPCHGPRVYIERAFHTIRNLGCVCAPPQVRRAGHELDTGG